MPHEFVIVFTYTNHTYTCISSFPHSLLLICVQFCCMVDQWSVPFISSAVCLYLYYNKAVTNIIIGAYIAYIIKDLTIAFYTISVFIHHAPGSLQIVNNSSQVSVILLSFIIHCTSICIMDKLKYGVFHQAVLMAKREVSQGGMEKEEKIVSATMIIILTLFFLVWWCNMSDSWVSYMQH